MLKYYRSRLPLRPRYLKVYVSYIRYIMFEVTPPKPHYCVDPPLKSSFELDFIVTEVNRLLPQLTEFINQFNNLVCDNHVNVITDASGNMSMDVPSSMGDTDAANISNRLSIIDRLITNHGITINDLFQKGISVEEKARASDPKYVSRLTEQISAFKDLNNSYKH